MTAIDVHGGPIAPSAAADLPATVADATGSETAQAIAALVPSLPDDTLRQLHRLMRHSLDAASAAERREAVLGLLLEMVSSRTGEIPSRLEYDTLQQVRAAGGELWPSSEQVVRAHGHWLRAVRSALRFTRDGGRARIQARPKSAQFGAAYSRDEVIFAIRRFHRRHGSWPTPWEFVEWGQLERRHAREHGRPNPRVPGMKQLTKLFGTYDRAVAAARAWRPMR